MWTWGLQSSLIGGAGDVDYPHYLINGRIPAEPATFAARPGQRVRIRTIDAGTDTAFRIALGGHRFTVTRSDGFSGRGFAVVRTASGPAPRADVHPAELDRQVLLGAELTPATESQLANKTVDRTTPWS